MALSGNSVTRLMDALANRPSGAEVATAINNGAQVAGQTVQTVAAMIVAAHVSQTTDFGALLPGDVVVHIPTVAGNSSFTTVVTAGTLPVAAVVGDLYLAMRALVLPTAASPLYNPGVPTYF